VGLQIPTRESSGITILDLRGRLTIDDGENALLRNQLEELITNGARRFLLNLADLTQIDSSGVGTIVKAYRSIRDQGGDLRLLRPSGHALEVFRALHLLEMIPSFDEENLALASFSHTDRLAKPQGF
jgi:anti-anti-sigma factor